MKSPEDLSIKWRMLPQLQLEQTWARTPGQEHWLCGSFSLPLLPTIKAGNTIQKEKATKAPMSDVSLVPATTEEEKGSE